MWMWRRIAKSALMPIRSHDMVIYRNKLEQIAGRRNGKEPQAETGDSTAVAESQ